WPPRVTLGRLLPHARGLGFKSRREGFPSGAKKEWGLSPEAKVRVLHTAQLELTPRISFSRRTPKQVSEIIIREFQNNPNGEDPNPHVHLGLLALADAFVTTADRVSMSTWLEIASSMGSQLIACPVQPVQVGTDVNFIVMRLEAQDLV
nr:hypothetical protein [Tanacetum cinerariifolium]